MKKSVQWKTVVPILLLGVATVVPAVIRTRDDFSMWIYIGLPVFLSCMAMMVVLLVLRRRRSTRVWAEMVQSHPTEQKNIVFVYLKTKNELTRLGWRLHGNALASIPAIGVVFGDDVSFWEYNVAGPTFRLPFSAIEHAKVSVVPDALREHLALSLLLIGGTRQRSLLLNVRTSEHRQVDESQITALADQLNRKIRAETAQQRAE